MMPTDNETEASSQKQEQAEVFRSRFADKLRGARLRKKASQEVVAQDVGINPQTLINYEGAKTLPDAHTLKRLADCLGLDLNSLLDTTLSSSRIRAHGLEEAIEFLSAAGRLGVTMFYLSREAALGRFAEYLKDESESIRIVGSSIKGLTEWMPDFKDILRSRRSAGVTIQVVLSSPFFSALREIIEDRRDGGIWTEIEEAWALLVETIGLSNQDVRFFPGTPTVFLLATSSRMLLNPYMYGRVAYQTFSVEVERGSSPDNIYEMYMHGHFGKAWDNSITCEASPRADGKHDFFSDETTWREALAWYQNGRKIQRQLMPVKGTRDRAKKPT